MLNTVHAAMFGWNMSVFERNTASSHYYATAIFVRNKVCLKQPTAIFVRENASF